MAFDLIGPIFALPLRPVEKLVLLALADQANQGGACWPAVASIARRTSLSVRAVRKALVDLEAHGAIAREFQPGRSTVFRVTPARCSARHLLPSGTSCRPPRHMEPGGRNVEPEGEAHRAAESTNESVKEPVKEPVTGGTAPNAYSREFDEVWAAYPRRNGTNSKRDAFVQFSKCISKGSSIEDLHAAVRAYSAWAIAEGKVGTSFVMQASTFFGPGRHFENDWTIARPHARPTSRVHDDANYDAPRLPKRLAAR